MSLIARAAILGAYGDPKKVKAAAGVVELKRTCGRCGHVWYVTPAEAKLHAPSSLQVAGLKMQSAGNRAKLVGGKKAMIAEQRHQRAARAADRVEQINRCASCGSGKRTEEAP